MTREDQRLAVLPDLIQLGVTFLAQDVTHAIFQVFVTHRQVMKSRYETQLGQRSLDRTIRHEERARGGNLEVFCQGVLKACAIREAAWYSHIRRAKARP